MSGLKAAFRPRSHFNARSGNRYSLLPLRFLALDDSRYIVTNLVGEHLVLPRETVHALVRHELPMNSAAYAELKASHFVVDADSAVALDLLALKYRTKQAFLSQFTSLFMFVTTLRCEHSCRYCQVSRQSESKHEFDMTVETAKAAVDFMFKSPSPSLKVEFQGGESLLNFEIVKHIVARVEERNLQERRAVEFVIATNLAPLSEEHLRFCADHHILISTSLDGPESLHNFNRPKKGKDSYALAVDGIRRARAALGKDRVSALMTTTEASFERPKEIVDEYVAQGFDSIFLRSISPYGFAVKTGQASRYQMAAWLDFYKTALSHIIDLNLRGVPFREEFASLILRKILTPWPTGYVDLQSPAGIGISALVFNYDGAIYASDESRMLAEMGDQTFRLGTLGIDEFETVMTSDRLLQPLLDSMSEGVPMCSDCALQPYCGADPVHHHATQGNSVGFKPTSSYCQKTMGVVRHLIGLLEDDPAAAHVLRGWV
ncbi:His-Xaa-Ser system radical SAM maturase HxsB [Aggregicoccus sp. 17bor-14]|uniref:His-Xaa-Ser system radical SAM maturase HxsB n=1 Tax=Myxococcaceae TaxID=31 RepID=UPI00129C9216|nr:MULTISPECIES: His-Xaa-Ser system radical SAM maturase HxsB [Myxococcaceae]MBF5043308.1 His-Xaa-Ser system radical SAM maturase HxsB [Simulacricoccus sp. 17bor-14]MRI89067.1 His-Xaa-Ser system radical SAM maturase HxsB [Aggregicoccus sp. 17bor-14]